MVNQAVGFDANKKVKGRKRHVVDTLGLIILVVVSAANVPEREGARLVFTKLHQIREQFPRLVRIWVDGGGYEGKNFMPSVMDAYRWILETIKRSDPAKGFVLLPRRWVVERT